MTERSDAADPSFSNPVASSPGTRQAFGEYLRAQRKLARLTLRELGDLAHVSNPYLSQVERGIHQPSVQVLTSIARALDVSVEALINKAAGLDAEAAGPSSSGTEAAIRNDPALSEAQKDALLRVYRSFVDTP
jgi:transcriptional regulator with XRE-family HTH domain